jgi:hypothetical protein
MSKVQEKRQSKCPSIHFCTDPKIIYREVWVQWSQRDRQENADSVNWETVGREAVIKEV